VAEIRIDTVTVDDLVGLSAEWDALTALQGCPDPLRRASWLRAWWYAFGATRDRREALILTARTDGRLVGAAPLMIERFPGGPTALRHLGNSSHWFDPDFLIDPAVPAARDALAAEIAEIPCDLIVLEDLAEGSPTIGALRGTMPRALVIAQGESRHRFRTADPPALGKRRKANRNRIRVAERAGRALDITTAVDADEIVAGLDEALDLTERVWRVRGDSSEVTHPAGRRYVREAVTGLSSGQATLTRVRANGTLVAFDLALREGAGAVMFRGNWDPESGISGGGWMSMLAAMDHLVAAGAEEIDFGKFDWPYKQAVSSVPQVGLVTVALPRGVMGAAALRLWRSRPALLAMRTRIRTTAQRVRTIPRRGPTEALGGGGTTG
jgi:CelD/BcsL family acetyltransferase involved in cellulose biosynthesis